MIRRLILFLISIALLNLFLSTRTYASDSFVELDARVQDSTLPSPGETITGTITFLNYNPHPERVTGTATMRFSAVGGDLTSPDSSYFSDPGQQFVDEDIPAVVGTTPGKLTLTFTTRVQAGSACLTGNVQIRGDPIPVTPFDNVNWPAAGNTGQTNGGIGATLIVDVVDEITGTIVPGADVTIFGTYTSTQPTNSSGFVTFSRLNCGITHRVEARSGTKVGLQGGINTNGTPGVNYICNGTTQRITVRIAEAATPTPVPPTPTPTPAPVVNTAGPLSCTGPPALLSASWTGNTQTSCNIYIRAGITDYQISTACTGNWSGSTLPGGPAVVDGGTYQLFASDGSKTLDGGQATCPTVAPTSTPIPTPTPPVGALNLQVSATPICTTSPPTESISASWSPIGSAYDVILRGTPGGDESHFCITGTTKTFTKQPPMNGIYTVSAAAYSDATCLSYIQNSAVTKSVPTNLACATPTPTPACPVGTTYTISGTVTKQTGGGVNNATVCLDPPAGGCATAAKKATTNPSGSYSIAGVTSGGAGHNVYLDPASLTGGQNVASTNPVLVGGSVCISTTVNFSTTTGPTPTPPGGGGVTPTPTPGPTGCTISAPSSVSTNQTFNVGLSGPAGTYTLTCPAGDTRTGSPGDAFGCTAPSDPGTYQVSATGPASCSATVTARASCTVTSNMNGPYIYTYKDVAWNNTNYVQGVSSQWPQYFFCPDGGSCTFGTATGNVSDAKRNDGTYCGYTTIGTAVGMCRLARFPVPSNYSSVYPFNQPLSSATTALQNVVVHADSVCGSYTTVTDSYGQGGPWKDASGQSVSGLPRATRSGRIDYDIWAGVPSGRKFTRAVYYGCGGGCNDFDGVDGLYDILGPTDQAKFYGFDTGSTTRGHNFRFGFTNPGTEPLCNRLTAITPASGPHPLTTTFFPTTGYQADGHPISYGYDFDGNSIIDQWQSTTTPVTNTYNTVGTYNANLYIKDNTTNLLSFPTSNCQVPISVQCANLQVTPNPLNINPGQSAILTISGNDVPPQYTVVTVTNPPDPVIAVSGTRRVYSGEDYEDVLVGQTITVTAIKEGTATITFTEYPASAGSSCDYQNVTVTVNVVTKPWFQTKEGDVRSGGSISSMVPSGKSFSLDGSGGSPSPGIVFYGSSGTANFGYGGVSSTNWLAQENYAGTVSTYDSLLNKANPTGDPIANLDCKESNNCNGVYQMVDSLTINSKWKILNGKKVIIFVPGNLNIQGGANQTNIEVERGGFLAFIVKGDITVNSSIGYSKGQLEKTEPNVEGWYITDGDFQTTDSGASDEYRKKRLNVAGLVYLSTGSLNNQRDLGADNKTDPSLFISYRLDLALNAPNFFSKSNIQWQEVAP